MKPAKAPRRYKFKHVELPNIDDYITKAALVADLATQLSDGARAIRDDANVQVNGYRERFQQLVDKGDLRPRLFIKPLPKNIWAVALNSVTYSLGPYDNFGTVDEDEPRFWWSGPDNVIHPARSMFQALIGVLQDYCKDARHDIDPR